MKILTFPGSLLVILGVLLVFAGCTQAGTGSAPAIAQEPKITPVPAETVKYTPNETLVAFVESAAAYVKAHGSAEALAEFNNPDGSFVNGELYIYAYGFNGTTLAHPVSPESVGKVREGEIGRFVTEMGSVVRNGSGFYRFTYVNPQHNRTLESKMGYGIQVADDYRDWDGNVS